MHRNLSNLLGPAILTALVIAGCGSDVDDEPPSEIAASYESFEYYGACGNETVDVDGTVFYPVTRAEAENLEAALGADSELEESMAPAGFARVAPPGPGDDVGTMVVFTDGTARFESDSGNVTWLTDEERTYGFEC